MNGKRVVIVGGVAGGASAAARARRLSEAAEIIILERGPHVSFANCGLPYYVGGEIEHESDLLVQTPLSLRARFNLDVRVRHEVLAINPKARILQVRELESGRQYELGYDALVLAPGAAPVKPPIPGIDRAGHFTVRNVPDATRMVEWIQKHQARRAVVVGGGYIGLEMAEQLSRRNLSVSLVEALEQVMSPLDPEIAALAHQELRAHGITLHLGDAVAAFEQPAAGESAQASVVLTCAGLRLPADLVVMGIGVRPETGLARSADLRIGELGGIRVDERMQTSQPNIWAVGDVVEVRDRVTGGWALVPLAGPANRQGRIAANNIFGHNSIYEGTWGTAILRVFGLTVGATGANEARLRKARIPFAAVHVHPGSHAGYYPGAQSIAIKLLFAPDNGKLLGAQVAGGEGADKRLDVLATALQAGMDVHAISELELAYAPPYGSAKDPVNIAGMAAKNVIDGHVALAHWHEIALPDGHGQFVLDVRTDQERKQGFIPGSTHIPLHLLRSRLEELPRDREIIVHCLSGQRSYYASRILAQHGFKVRNLSGSWKTWTTATRR